MKNRIARNATVLGATLLLAGVAGNHAAEARQTNPAEPSHREVRDRFAQQVATLSSDAKPVDSMWSGFVTACQVKPVTANDGRAWFALWENRVQADYSTGQCRDLFNQMVAAGEVIKKGMAAAEDVARKTLTAGEIRDIRKLSLMDWDGWALPAPQKREP